MKKTVLCMLLVCTIVTGFVGILKSTEEVGPSLCETEEDSTKRRIVGNVDITEEVDLIMYRVATKGPKTDALIENLNALLKEKINTTLTFKFIPLTDWYTKYSLPFTSGEIFDFASCANWLGYYDLAKSGALMRLDELWPRYAPDVYEMASREAKEDVTVEGAMYGIPTLTPIYNCWGINYRTDLLSEAQWDGKMESFEDLEKYCDLIKQYYPEMEPIGISNIGGEMDRMWLRSHGYFECNVSNGYLDLSGDIPQIRFAYQMEEIPEFLEMMKRWNEKGFWSKSCLSDTNTSKFVDGVSAVLVHNGFAVSETLRVHPDWGVNFVDLSVGARSVVNSNDTMVISNTCEHPERVLLLWNLICTDQEVFDAWYYGIEGESYILNEDGSISYINGTEYDLPLGIYSTVNDRVVRKDGTTGVLDGWNEIYRQKIAEDDRFDRLRGFTFDASAVQEEYDACARILRIYWQALELGFSDPAEGLADLKARMEEAGAEQILEEANRQLAEYCEEIGW